MQGKHIIAGITVNVVVRYDMIHKGMLLYSMIMMYNQIWDTEGW